MYVSKQGVVTGDIQPARAVLFQAYSEFCSNTFAPPPNAPPLSTFLDISITKTQEELQVQEKRPKNQAAIFSSKSKTSKSIRSISVAALTPVLRGKNQIPDESRDIANSGLAIQMKKSHKRVQSLDTNQPVENSSSFTDPVPGDGKLSVIGSISESSFLKIDQDGLRAFGGDIIERPRTPSERKISEETSDQLALWSYDDIENDDNIEEEAHDDVGETAHRNRPIFRLESFRDSTSSEDEKESDFELSTLQSPNAIMRCHSVPKVKIMPATPSTEISDNWKHNETKKTCQRFVC